MRTTFMANENNVERKWYVVDAEGQTLGRLSTEVASLLRGNTNQHTRHMSILAITSLSLTQKRFI